MKNLLQKLNPRWLFMATPTAKPTPGLFDPNTQIQGGLPVEVREQMRIEKMKIDALKRAQGNLTGNAIGSFGETIAQVQHAAYQKAKANADYEQAMAARRREIHVKIVPGSNGWVVEMEGQDPWVCKDITELGETITSAIGVRVLEGGSK